MFDPFTTTPTQIAPSLAEPARKKRASKHDFQDGLGRVFAHRHANGGGWVADTAKVDEKAFVGKRASVYHHAVITGNVLVQNYAQVCGAATITTAGNVAITQYAMVGGRANISANSATIADYAKIFGGVISGSCKFKDNAEVREQPTLRDVSVFDKCWIGGAGTLTATECRGHARIYGSPDIRDSVLRGWVIVKQSAIITNSHITALQSPASFYGGLSPEQIKTITENVDITGSCIIGGQTLVFYSEISCTLHTEGTTEFVRSKLRFSQPFSREPGGVRYEIVDIDRAAKFIGVDLSDYNRFRAMNVPFDAVLRSPVASPNRGQPFDFDAAARPRRITAMEPK